MNLALGILLVVVGGALEGLFSLGVTRTPKWKWENIWGLGSLIALVAVPWPLAWFCVPQLGEVFREAGSGTILIVLLFGIGWGLGGIFWGKAIAAVGMALGVSLLMGFVNVFGGPAPLWIFSPEKAGDPSAWALYAAVVVMIGGIAMIALAGKRKEMELAGGAVDAASEPEPNDTPANPAAPSTPFAIALVFCVLSGALSACVNLGLVYGKEIGKMDAIAEGHGAPDWATAFAVWALVFTGNYAVNFLYAFALMIANGNLTDIFTKGDASHWFWAVFLGLAWPLGIVLFGIGAGYMGPMGSYAAFPMMLLCAVLFGNLAGALQGEWAGTSARSKGVMLAGVSVLLAAFALLGYSARLSDAPADTPPDRQEQAGLTHPITCSAYRMTFVRHNTPERGFTDGLERRLRGTLVQWTNREPRHTVPPHA